MSALLLQYVRILATQAKELPVGVCQLLIQMYPRLIICSSFVMAFDAEEKLRCRGLEYVGSQIG